MTWKGHARALHPMPLHSQWRRWWWGLSSLFNAVNHFLPGNLTTLTLAWLLVAGLIKQIYFSSYQVTAVLYHPHRCFFLTSTVICTAIRCCGIMVPSPFWLRHKRPWNLSREAKDTNFSAHLPTRKAVSFTGNEHLLSISHTRLKFLMCMKSKLTRLTWAGHTVWTRHSTGDTQSGEGENREKEAARRMAGGMMSNTRCDYTVFRLQEMTSYVFSFFFVFLSWKVKDSLLRWATYLPLKVVR